MYIDTCKTDKYVRHLLRENYREGGKVKHRTVANLSSCSGEEIDAMKLALKHKKDLSQLISVSRDITLRQGKSVGSVWVVYETAKKLGIVDALGSMRHGKLALWQVIARVIDQGSRLSAVRLAGTHAACDILGFSAFNEDDLYRNLDWLAENQADIEDRLYWKTPSRGLFLYDVTSSYLEGECNEFAAFGYNRDGKKGKRQIVIGLLCDAEGRPLSIEVFPGNTQDTVTFASQIKKISERFGGGDITLVGDRGMVKNTQQKDILEHEFHYITAITKSQIESLLNQGIIQLTLFDQDIAEVQDNDIRYILRKNPVRAQEIQRSRQDKLKSLNKSITKKNSYLAEHPRASIDIALRDINEYASKLKISGWVIIEANDRIVSLRVNDEALESESMLDGCYVLKTDLKPSQATKETVHERYKDLALVEWAFRTSKTVALEMRPIHVRLASRTKGHAFVVMLAYLIIRELAKNWKSINLTVGEGIRELSTVCAMDVLVKDKPVCAKIPEPRELIKKLLSSAHIVLPDVIPSKGIIVATRKSLVNNRKS
jgi:hypothetical protein